MCPLHEPIIESLNVDVEPEGGHDLPYGTTDNQQPGGNSLP